ISGNWDSLEVITGDHPALQTALLARLRNTPGINHIHEVREYPLGTLDELAELCVERFTDQLAGKTFAVRCKRVGHHPFTSNDVNREIGSRLMLTGVPAGVSLWDAQGVVQLEMRQQRVFLMQARHEGLGGLPLGTMEPVLSPMSRGFDSTVASYQMLQRGVLPHFVFFNLGGRAHELGVRQ